MTLRATAISAAQVSEKTGRCGDRFFRKCPETLELIACYEPSSAGEDQVGLRLELASACDVYEVRKFAMTVSTETFSDITRGGGQRAARLVAKSAIKRCRPPLKNCTEFLVQPDR